MRAQLIQYVDLLFAGARDCADVRDEILQNTLDRYDDLILEGKSPEAAYRLAIMGIGDINEILGMETGPAAAVAAEKERDDTPKKKKMRAIAVALYILCPVPLIILAEYFNSGVLGVTCLFAMIAAATVLMILGAVKEEEPPERQESELEKSIGSLVWTIGLALYFVVSFLTQAWHITWVIFPMIGAVKGLVKAILDLKEANRHENQRNR